LGIGDWGLGIGDWGLGPIPNPQSPIPNPQFGFIILYLKIKRVTSYYLMIYLNLTYILQICKIKIFVTLMNKKFLCFFKILIFEYNLIH
jgi:hypothetical protein